MLLRIEHETRYLFDEPASYSIQRLRLEPGDFEGQKVMDWTVEIRPGGSVSKGHDTFGNIMHLAAHAQQHSGITLTARGNVETVQTDGVVRGSFEPIEPKIYLRSTTLTAPNADLVALANEGREAKDGPLDVAHRLVNVVRDAIDYEKGQTLITTSAADALALGRGVCQDHAHAFICCARLCGIPARYVGGYMWDDEGSAALEAGHGWAEAYIEGLGWVGFDPANRQSPTEAYVRVAVGFDYLDASPVRGMRRSGGGETLDVEVRITQSQHQSQVQ